MFSYSAFDLSRVCLNTFELFLLQNVFTGLFAVFVACGIGLNPNIYFLIESKLLYKTLIRIIIQTNISGIQD